MVLLAVVCATFAVKTWTRNGEWMSEASLYESGLQVRAGLHDDADHTKTAQLFARRHLQTDIPRTTSMLMRWAGLAEQCQAPPQLCHVHRRLSPQGVPLSGGHSYLSTLV